MFFHDLILGVFYAFILVAPITVISLIGSYTKEETLITGAVLTIVGGLITGLIFWVFVPPVGFSEIAINHNYWLLFWGLVVVAVLVGIAAGYEEERATKGTYIVGALLIVALCYGITQQGVWTDGSAKKLAHQTHVVEQEPEAYPDTDADHILQVPEQTADFLADQVLASSADKKLGTIYKVRTGVLQSVNDHLYWIYALEPTGWRNSNKVPNAEVPGFVVVDAENPNTHPQLRLEDDSGKKYHIRYYRGGYHWHKLERFVWANGYRDQLVSEATLEVDDNWRPYYTATLAKPIVGFTNNVPGTALVIDPQTGKIDEYPLGPNLEEDESVKLPDWVDRVYDKGTVEKMLNWWGRWAQAKRNILNESSANRYKVSGDPILVYTTGGHPVWQAIMSSYSKDTSAAYLALFDARDNEARLYSIQGLTLASAAEHTILGSSKNTKNPPLEPVHLSLHKIYGHLTWVAPLIRPNGDNSNSSAQQGIALLPYDETNGDNVVIATNMASALTAYRVNLANGNDNAGPEENAYTTSVEGTVSYLSQVVESGNTVLYFTLNNDSKHVYRAALQISGSPTQNLELPFIQVGTKVRLTYLDTGSARRDVGAYDDLNLQVGTSG